MPSRFAARIDSRLRRTFPRLACTLTLAACGIVAAAAQVNSSSELSGEEIRQILRHGPWPAQWTPDPSNRVSGNAQAVKLGRALFFDPRLSASGKVACATCHQPHLGFSDGRARAVGLVEVDRNTLGLLDVRYNRWFGWDGASDNLWAQSLRPIVDAREMGGSSKSAAALIRNDARLRQLYVRVFGGAAAADEERIAVNIAKALAAFQEPLVSARAPFDAMRDALARGDAEGMAAYPAAARRGLKIFFGKGACNLCHFGPTFSNGEFDEVGVSYFISGNKVDSGRHEGIRRLQASPYTLLGAFSDDPQRTTATSTRHVDALHRNFGTFRVPTLRNLTRTAPYMHDGSLATLRDVVRHYSEINPDRLHADGQRALKPLRLSEAEIDDLVAFLESLTAPEDAARTKR